MLLVPVSFQSVQTHIPQCPCEWLAPHLATNQGGSPEIPPGSCPRHGQSVHEEATTRPLLKKEGSQASVSGQALAHQNGTGFLSPTGKIGEM